VKEAFRHSLNTQKVDLNKKNTGHKFNISPKAIRPF